MKARKKRNYWPVVVCGIVLTLGSLARAGVVGQDVNWADPNEVNWFSASWTSAMMSAMLDNPAENSESVAKGVTRTLNVYGKIRILDPNRVVSLSASVADV